jgi:hypothetical protein
MSVAEEVLVTWEEVVVPSEEINVTEEAPSTEEVVSSGEIHVTEEGTDTEEIFVEEIIMHEDVVIAEIIPVEKIG